MLRNFFVNSLFGCLVLLSLSCRESEESIVISGIPANNIDGLLTGIDTTKIYDIGLRRLSEYNFFKNPLKELIPSNNRIVPYAMNAPLFTDYASKKRFMSIPKGTQISFRSEGVLEFPIGTILIKTFYYKASELLNSNTDVLIETRLLIKENDTSDWLALPYIWNESQTEAYLYILGKDIKLNVAIEGKDQLSFVYTVPNINMCKNCHINDKSIIPLGPTARQLNRTNLYVENIRENQLEHLYREELISNLIPIDSIKKIPDYSNSKSGSLDERARAYLDVNCAHCHQENGSAKTSGLSLGFDEKDNFKLGVNKAPVAAGSGSGNLSFDIVKGHPEKSILLYRMKHLEPGIVMPEIGKNTLHIEGIRLIEDWIKSLDD